MLRPMFALIAVIGFTNGVSTNAAPETIVYSFTGAPADGSYPGAGLIVKKGMLYGTTVLGGAYANGTASGGTAFSIKPKSGAEQVLHSFGNGSDGNEPTASLLDVEGVIYGTTTAGGASNRGAVFSITPNHRAETVVYSFCALEHCADGSDPGTGLIARGDNLYCTTATGGNTSCDIGCGTVFALDRRTGAESVVYAFCSEPNCADGSGPSANLVDVNGTLYGTTAVGGDSSCNSGYGCGTVFALDPQTGTETVLHSFVSNGKDGMDPEAGLIRLRDKLYGSTVYGGSSPNCEGGCGTVFAIDLKTDAETVVHSFDDLTGDAEPITGLVSVKDWLYGTTLVGYGTVYALNRKTGSYSVLYGFCSTLHCTDGADPIGGLLFLNSMLYGTTARGGTSTNCEDGCGTVFAIQP